MDFKISFCRYFALRLSSTETALVRVEGGYYPAPLSYRTVRATFIAHGSQIFLGLLFPFAHVDIVVTRFM